MSFLFGWCGENRQFGREKITTPLKAFPHVKSVIHYTSDRYVIAKTETTIAGGRVASFADGRYVLIFDGWIANRSELFSLLGVAVTACSDSDLVGTALLAWGRDALVRLHGQFLISWWDQAEQELLLACDRIGGRTAFYWAQDQDLCFANPLAPLFLHPAVPRILDPSAVARAAYTAELDLGKSCFRGINQLLPGYHLTWTPRSGARTTRYWALDPSRHLRLPRDEDYVDAARSILDQAVREAIPSKGPVVSMLSGGLDSGGVTSTAARIVGDIPVHAITLRPDCSSPLPPCPPRQFQDEWAHAQSVAACYPSVIAHSVPATDDGWDDILRGSFYWLGRPPVDCLSGVWASAAWAKARQLGATSILVGLAGNATFSASGIPYRLKVRGRDWPDALWSAVQLKSLGRPVLPYLRSFAPDWLRDIRDSLRQDRPFHRMPMALTTNTAQGIAMAKVWRDFTGGDDRASWRQRSRLRLIERSWNASTLVSCMRFRDGVERRDPLADVRLAEFCLAIPSRQFIRLGQDRWLARRVLADRLPATIVAETRLGRQIPEWHHWLGRRRDWLAAELDKIEASSLGREMIDVPRLRSILANWPSEVSDDHFLPLVRVLGQGTMIGSFIRWAEGQNS